MFALPLISDVSLQQINCCYVQSHVYSDADSPFEPPKRLVFGWRRNPTSASWREAELGRNLHHDFRLAISDRDVRRLDWIASRRFDHGAVFLDRLGCLRPKGVSPAIGRKRCNIRQLFRGAEVRSRDDVIAELQTLGGNQRIDGQIREEIDNGIRTAVRRDILESRGDRPALSTRGIADYQRDFLKDQFVAAMQGHAWAEREDSIRRFSRWLGFRRTGPTLRIPLDR